MSDKKYREFWINSFYDSPEEHAGWKFRRAWDGWTEIVARTDPDLIHTVEISAFQAAQEKIRELEDFEAQTIQLLSELDDKHNSLKARADKLRLAANNINYHSDDCRYDVVCECANFKLREAIQEYDQENEK